MSGIVHVERGQGAPLILLHGYCENHRIWERLAEKLSTTFHVLMPDLPGFGESPLLPGSFTIEDAGVALMQWMEDQQLSRPVIVGHSLGGYVALAMVNAGPEKFAGLGLFHSTSYSDTDEKKENRNKVIDFVKRNGAAPFIETFVPGLFYKKNHPMIGEVYAIAMETRAETIVAYAAAMRDRPSRMATLESFQRPILMIAGEHDTILPYDQLLQQTQLMRFPFFSGLPESAHMGMLESEPESIKIVSDFTTLAVEFSPP